MNNGKRCVTTLQKKHVHECNVVHVHEKSNQKILGKSKKNNYREPIPIMTQYNIGLQIHDIDILFRRRVIRNFGLII